MADPNDPNSIKPMDAFPPREPGVLPPAEPPLPGTFGAVPGTFGAPPGGFGAPPGASGFGGNSGSAAFGGAPGSFGPAPGFAPQPDGLRVGAASTYDPTSPFGDRRDFRGNYLLTVGNPGSGKSTFQRQLAMCLLTSKEEFSGTLITGADWSAQNLLNRWLQEWTVRQSFPAPTKVDEVTEFAFRVTPHERKHLPLEFNIVEIAGEAFVRLQLQETGAPVTAAPQLNPGLAALLASPNVNLVVALAVDGEIGIGQVNKDRQLIDDLVFSTFLRLLGQLRPEGVCSPASVMIVVSKPAKALNSADLAARSSASAHRREALEAFASQKLQQTFGILGDPSAEVGSAVFGMHIGQVVDDGAGNRTIHNPSFSDCRHAFRWAYREFTGKHTRRLFTRVVERLAGGGE